MNIQWSTSNFEDCSHHFSKYCDTTDKDRRESSSERFNVNVDTLFDMLHCQKENDSEENSSLDVSGSPISAIVEFQKLTSPTSRTVIDEKGLHIRQVLQFREALSPMITPAYNKNMKTSSTRAESLSRKSQQLSFSNMNQQPSQRTFQTPNKNQANESSKAITPQRYTYICKTPMWLSTGDKATIETGLPCDAAEICQPQLHLEQPNFSRPRMNSGRFAFSSQELASPTDAKNGTHDDLLHIAPRRFTRWAPSEDEILSLAVEAEGGPPTNWNLISNKYFEGTRNANQCKGRWKKHHRPGLNLKAWSPEEDDILVAQRSLGLSWPQIAALLPGRVADQVRERYNNFLDPLLNKGPFTEKERGIILDMQKSIGNKWTTIAKALPGRSENMVKNYWHNSKLAQRRKLKRLCGLSRSSKTVKRHSEKDFDGTLPEEVLGATCGIITHHE